MTVKRLLALLALVIASTAIAEEPVITEQQRAAMKQAGEFRTFTTTNGISITAHPYNYSETTERVELLTEDSSRQTVELQELSEKDRAYIQDWYSAYSILEKKRLRISLEEETLRDRIYGTNEWALLPKLNEGRRWRTIIQNRLHSDNDNCDSTQYTLCVENKSGHQLNDIQIEYCIYHKATVKEELLTTRYDKDDPSTEGYDGGLTVLSRERLLKRTAIDLVAGVISIDTLASTEEVTSKTKRMVSPVADRESDAKGVREIDCKILGIRYRVYLPTPNGNWAMMEFAEPKSLLKETDWPSE